MTRAILTCFHKYTPFGGEFYEPILDFYLQNMKKYEDEYDKLYLIDSTWNIDPKKIAGMKAEIVKINPHLRYYDAYKEILPQVKEDLVLFLDDDMVIYKDKAIDDTFNYLHEGFDVISIYDTIGEKTFPELNGKSKFCPYWFATQKELLMAYRDCEWGPVPWGETLSELTLKMLENNMKPYEWEEDKSNILFDGIKDGEKSKDLGYYHIRAGSTPAYLLATKKYGDINTYNDYLKNQPKNEYLRQFAWYRIMQEDINASGITLRESELLKDINIGMDVWADYILKFRKYHGL